MPRKKARFDVVAIEIMVHCPHCDSPAKSPLDHSRDFIWTTAAIAETAGRDVKCRNCQRVFALPYSLRQMLMPSSEPVSSDRYVGVARIEIICGTCAGDGLEPILTLMATDGRCSSCGGRNYGMPAQPQHSNGKEIS